MSILSKLAYLPLQVVFSGTKANKIFQTSVVVYSFKLVGSIYWIEGWMHLLYVVFMLTTKTVSKELQEERATAPTREDTKLWDKLLVTGIALTYGLGPLLLGGFEGTQGMQGVDAAMLAGITINVVSIFGFHYTMRTNQYFSSMVRIQSDRGHKVCDKGPYQYVRHPGYIFMTIAMAFGIPLVFHGTRAQFMLGGFSTLIMLVRTQLEDSALQKELDGYAEYSQKVRSKLIPIIF